MGQVIMFTFKSNFIGNSNFTCRKVNYFGKARIKRTILYSSISLAFVMMALFICPPFHYDDSNAMTGTPVASDTTLSISVDNDVLSLDLTPLSANGTFATTTTPATVYVTTNNITGYTLGIRTTSSTDTATKLVNNIDECVDTPTSTKCSLSTIDNAVSEEDYEATTSTDLNNTWGYLPSKYNSEINENYLPAPSSNNVDILDITSTPNSADTTTGELVPNEYTIDLGSRIDYTPYAGQYSGTLVITAVGNPVSYSVSYDSNIPAPATISPTSATVSNMPNAQAGEVSGGDTIAVVLSTKTPVLSGSGPYDTDRYDYHYVGYAFAGWCTEPTRIIDDGSGKDYQFCPDTATLYQPGDNYGIDQTEYNQTTLYAVWSYATDIEFDGNGNDDGEQMKDIVVPVGKTVNLPLNIYTKKGYYFVEWNTNPTPTEQDPGMSYSSQAEYQAGAGSNNITLYAQWRELPKLYDTVKALVKKADGNERTQTLADIQATITAPTTTDPATDTSNSGVYKYDANTFGAASDASNDYAIYYYRGILEPEVDQGSVGSEGKATTYPNYVRLGNNTCWRIVRTTGSGGVKMIYNGIWTGSTCANKWDDARLSEWLVFNTESYTTLDKKTYTGLGVYLMQAAGYTYSTKATSIDAVPLKDILGATGDDTTTNTHPSIIKQYIEDWYSNNMITTRYDYTSIIEPLAGYCNDRSVYNIDAYSPTSVLPDSTMIIPSSGTLDASILFFGANVRNFDVAQNPSLTCPRGIVDNYSTTIESGGNGQLTYPIALLTADEMGFAGSGSPTATDGSTYDYLSFLNSGQSFWSLSPSFRNPYKYVISTMFVLTRSRLEMEGLNRYQNGVRPVISLDNMVKISAGSGTAIDPWTIDE